MNLKNYTSSVPIEKTIYRIESLLAESGAHGIQKDYKDGKLMALKFTMRVKDKPLTIRLPVNHAAVFETLKREVRKPRDGTMARIEDQAIKTSWKIMQDWVEVQLSLIALQQVDFMQVFLPYVWDGERTFYQAIKDNNFLALTESAT